MYGVAMAVAGYKDLVRWSEAGTGSQVWISDGGSKGSETPNRL